MRRALVLLVFLAGCATPGHVNPGCIDDCNNAAVTCMTWKSQTVCQAQQAQCVQRCRGGG